MIQRYENSPFFEYLTEKGIKFNVQNKSEKQIKQLLHNIRLLIQNKHNINISDLIAFVAIEIFENVSMSVNVDISGLSKLFQQDEIFKDHLNEFLIEYGLNLDVLKDVKYKLLFSFLKNCYIVYIMNKSMRKMNNDIIINNTEVNNIKENSKLNVYDSNDII